VPGLTTTTGTGERRRTARLIEPKRADVTAGRMWVLVPIWTLLVPMIVRRTQTVAIARM
jgi:hypothetical protein